ncbi:hypothetical protein, partial [Enterococcus avium]|uniref:hypothetical protein n=1 Tax=Enterococcus avium TaxID=33945 RepID=UPI001C63626F
LRPTSFSHNLTIATLSFANSSYCQACSGLSPPSFHSCRAHIKNSEIFFLEKVFAVLILKF